MATNVSGIYDLVSAGASDLLSGGAGGKATESSGPASAFQGQLDRAMQDGRKYEGAGKPLSNGNAGGTVETSDRGN